MSQSISTSSAYRQRSDTPETRLHGRWLLLARVGWLVAVFYALALFVGSLPTYYTLLQTPCSAAAGAAYPCGNLDGALDATGLEQLRAAGFSASGHAAYFIFLTVVVALIWVAIGLVIFWRRSDDWVALLGALGLVVTVTVQTSGPTTALEYAHPAWTLPVAVVNFLSNSGWLFIGLFPNGRFAPRWMRWIFLLFFLTMILGTFLPPDSPLSLNNVPALNGLMILSFFGALVYSQVYRYRHLSNAVQRQQIKWAVFGIILSLVLLIGVVIWSAALAGWADSQIFVGEVVSDTAWLLAYVPIPIFIGIAILRSRLWDIDTIINKALVYGLLTALLGALYAGLIIGLESLIGRFTTQTSEPIVLVISTLAIAALFQPVRRRIQQIIDRRFYREKYDAEKTLAAFSATLRNEVDLEQLREHLLAVVQESMQPTNVSLWLRQPERHPREVAFTLEPSGQTSTRPILE